MNPQLDEDGVTDGAGSIADGEGNRRLGKIVLVLGLLAAGLAGFLYRDQLRLESLAEHESTLRLALEEHPALVYSICFLVYVAVTGLSLPGAAALTLAYGWYLGTFRTVLLVSFASTLGATLAFLCSRYLFRDMFERRLGHRLAAFSATLREEGPLYLFTLRLIPLVPFFVINLVMGLTPIGTWTFWWVSQLGMLPGTVVYSFAGASVPTLSTVAEHGVSSVMTPRLWIAFACLGLFPFLAKRLMARFTNLSQLD